MFLIRTDILWSKLFLGNKLLRKERMLTNAKISLYLGCVWETNKRESESWGTACGEWRRCPESGCCSRCRKKETPLGSSRRRLWGQESQNVLGVCWDPLQHTLGWNSRPKNGGWNTWRHSWSEYKDVGCHTWSPDPWSHHPREGCWYSRASSF